VTYARPETAPLEDIVAVSIGDRIPDVEIKTMNAEGAPTAIRTSDALGSGTVVLFAVPGAFTPGCSRVHLPGFVARADELKEKGVGTIACVAVNDVWVMDAWGKSQGVGDKILMLADGSGEFTRALGLELDLAGVGLGRRSKRYAAIIEDGVIRSLDIDESGIANSACEAVLGKL
jgi:glutaredoxin/glutathione-dependent peroxiredoxin